jgi:D-3-phosphoglycerate dehydrogenase
VIGERLKKLKPFLEVAERIGRLQSQIIQGKLKEVTVEYSGDYYGLQLEPVTTALLNGLLDPLVTDTVNAVNAPAIAQEMGIRVSETASAEPLDFVNLMTVHVATTEGTQVVSGTVYGKVHPRIVRINSFRTDLSPQDAVLLILTANKPGDIGVIGTLLGQENVNISSLIIGQEENPGETNLILVRTKEAIADSVVDKLRKQELVLSVTPVLF